MSERRVALIDAKARALKTTDVGGEPVLDVNLVGTPSAIDAFIQNTLVKVAYDYVEATYPVAIQEVYTFKVGGAAGTTVATVTVNYSTAQKDVLLNASVT